jgi:Fe-S oxidoreductase
MTLQDYQGYVERCCRCSVCKFVPLQKVKGIRHSYVCPSISKYNFNAYSGGGRLLTIKSMLKNGLNYNDKLREIVYNCQMCGACGVSCNYAMDIEVMEPINELRIKCVQDGQTHPALDKVIAGLRKDNSMVPVRGKRGDWATGLGLKNATEEKVDVLYHVGCLTSYDPEMHKLAKATAKILQKVGINFGIAGDAEVCCGGRAYQMGYEDAFLGQAKKNMALIKKAGVKTLVTGCADGYRAFKVLYEKFHLKEDLQVLHITEYLHQLIREGKLKLSKRVDLNVTYHDPCNLGRLGEPWIHWEGKQKPGNRYMFDPPKEYRRGEHGVYEPPRGVLESIAGLTLSEMDRIKEYAWCCGAGGGVNESNTDFSIWTAQERIQEAESTGAEAIVTACPWCEKNFSEAIKAGGSQLKVYDIVELVEKAI